MDPAPSRRSWTADDLVDQTLPYVCGTDLLSVTLRGAAASIGTSHKVLLHHFGSREGYLAAVLQRVRGRLIERTASADPAATMRAMWEWYAADTPESRVLAQGMGLGLAEPDLGFARDAVAQYDALAAGQDPDLARLAQAAVRGLIIDGQVAGWERAGRSFELLMDLVERTLAPG